MVQRYREMADDPLRLDRFRKAISTCIGAGQIVADIGCGLGTFSVFACRAGAGAVYAVDANEILDVAREVVRDNGCADRVHFLAGRSNEITPTERVDVAIFEDYIAGLLSPGIVAVLCDLRARWLKPGGRLLPNRARMWMAPVEANDVRLSLDRFASTNDRVLGVDLSAARRHALSTPQMVSLRPAALLAEPVLMQDIDLATIEICAFGGQGRAIAIRDGVVHGVLVWFELELPPATLGTGPCDPPSAWRQVLLPFEPPLPISEGQSIDLEVAAAPLGEGVVWRWSATTPTAKAAAHSLDAAARVLRI